MQVSTARLHNAFKKVRQIREEMRHYCLPADCIPVPVKHVLETVQRAYGLNIEVRKVSKGGKNVKGLVLRRIAGDARAHIIVVSAQNPDADIRFVTVKEAAHLVNDEPEDWSMDGVGTVKEYYYEMSISNEKEAKPPVQSEAVAELSAIELLYPFDFRLHDAKELAAHKTTAAKLALHYDLPQPIVGRALSSYYMDFAAEIWAEIDAEAASLKLVSGGQG